MNLQDIYHARKLVLIAIKVGLALLGIKLGYYHSNTIIYLLIKKKILGLSFVGV